MADSEDYRPITTSDKDPNNIQAKKHFVFNETGNIMVATTDEKTKTNEIEKGVREVFAEVSVFFAAMTKAISTTIDPDSRSGRHYSLYNYNALESVIDGSGCFIHVAEEDVKYTINSWGVNFSQDLIKGLLGLATGTGALAFASAMVASVGKEGVNIKGDSMSSSKKAGNIIFVCEYLLGMPVVSAIVVYADMHENEQSFTLGPCIKEQSQGKDLTFHKDTYMFVTPKFIESYAGDLDKGMSDPAFLTLTSNFQKILTRQPVVLDVSTTDRVPVDAPNPLIIGQRYRLLGNFFGDSSITYTVANGSLIKFEGSVKLVTSGGDTPKTKSGKELEIQNANVNWNENAIEFSIGFVDSTQRWDESNDGGAEQPLFTIVVNLPKKLDSKTEPSSLADQAAGDAAVVNIPAVKCSAPLAYSVKGS